MAELRNSTSFVVAVQFVIGSGIGDTSKKGIGSVRIESDRIGWDRIGRCPGSDGMEGGRCEEKEVGRGNGMGG